jgi:uncharacterized membrane protein (DUF106 family)
MAFAIKQQEMNNHTIKLTNEQFHDMIITLNLALPI